MKASMHNTLRTATIAAALLLPLAANAQAAAIEHTGIIVDCAYKAEPGYVPGLDCALLQMVFIGRYLFGLSGAAALMAFVIGGFWYTFSYEPKNVAKGQAWMKNAAIGLVIILTSAYLIEYAVKLLVS